MRGDLGRGPGWARSHGGALAAGLAAMLLLAGCARLSGAAGGRGAGGQEILAAWGLNNNGQIGDGTTLNRWTPVAVAVPGGVTFTALSGGFAHTVAHASDDTAWAWGSNTFGQVGDGTSVRRLTPVPVQMPPGVSFVQVSAFEVHSLGLDADGRAWAWGWNRFGQLGDGTTLNRNAPVPVQMPPGVSFEAVDAGALHSIALDSLGRAWAWGNNATGALGDGSNASSPTPVAVRMPPGVAFVAVAGGLNSSLALDSEGRAWAWGLNRSGQLGDGTNVNRNVPVMVQAPLGVSFVSITTLGDLHAMALADDGAAWSWGDNRFGQLGDGSTEDRSTPVPVRTPPGVIFTQIQTADFHNIGLDPNGAAWSWGWNRWGQLGDGTTTDRTTPVRVQTPGGIFVGVSAGDHHTFGFALTG